MTEGLGRLLLAACCLLPAPLAAQKALQKRLDARLDAPPFNRQIWGVALVDEKGTMLFGRNADRMFMPASNTKIVVSAVAAALYDPEFTVRTSLYGSGPVVNGVLQGDLVLYGRGTDFGAATPSTHHAGAATDPRKSWTTPRSWRAPASSRCRATLSATGAGSSR
jgi:D-alanyl-D-alanine carboxypeptidase